MHVLAVPPCSSYSCAPSIGRRQIPGSREQDSPGLPSAAPELQLQSCYPSPPMSDKPSPPPRARPHPPQQKERNSPSQDQHDRREREQGAEHEHPGGRSSDPLGAPSQPHRRVIYEGAERQQQAPPPGSSSARPADQRPELRPSSTAPEGEHRAAEPSQMGPFGYSPFGASGSYNPGYGGPTLALQQPAPLASQVPLRNTKSARRNKAHVASACINCKRAHLSCDVQRPCTRCVASGKEATCYDVQHKKRGRPRLRDVQESRSQQAHEMAEHSTSASESPAASVPGLSAGHGRADSFRSLRSTRRSFGAPASIRQPPSQLQSLSPSPFPAEGAVQYPAPEYSRPALLTPMALLNLDLRIIKTNSAFNSLFSQSDMRGRELAGLVESHHVEGLQRLRSELREERDAREPTYMAPIFAPQERETVQNIEEEDLDHISQGYTDRVFTWRFSSLFGLPQEVRARVRLAKTSIFFVSLTLPPLPPSQLQPPHSEHHHRAPPVFATPAAPQRSSRPPSRTQQTPPTTEFSFQPYGQVSPLTASEPPSPYSPSYFTFQAMTASLPSAVATPPTAPYSYVQAPQSGQGYAPASWSSPGSAVEAHTYQVSARRQSGPAMAEAQWHNEPRFWPQQQYGYPPAPRAQGQRAEYPQYHQQQVYDPGSHHPETLAPAPAVRRVSSEGGRSQGASEATSHEEEPAKRRRLEIRDMLG